MTTRGRASAPLLKISQCSHLNCHQRELWVTQVISALSPISCVTFFYHLNVLRYGNC